MSVRDRIRWRAYDLHDEGLSWAEAFDQAEREQAGEPTEEETAAALRADPTLRPCVPVPHEAHWDEHGDCPGFVGPPEERFSEEAGDAVMDSCAHRFDLDDGSVSEWCRGCGVHVDAAEAMELGS